MASPPNFNGPPSPLPLSSRPLHEPPSSDERQFFAEMRLPRTRMNTGLGDRTSLRVARRVANLEHTLPHCRTCFTCHRYQVPYIRGNCPRCWRVRDPGRNVTTDPRLCSCPCLCSPEVDDPLDSDYDPNDVSEDEEVDQDDSHSGPGVLPSSIPLAAGLWFDRDVTTVTSVRNYFAESTQDYGLATEPQAPTNEFSSTLNSANRIDFFEEGIQLSRFVTYHELAHMLANGHTRDELRAQFPETRRRYNNPIPGQGRVRRDCHLPRDQDNSRVDATAHNLRCPNCYLPYAPDEMVRVARGFEIERLNDQIAVLSQIQDPPSPVADHLRGLHSAVDDATDEGHLVLCPHCHAPREEDAPSDDDNNPDPDHHRFTRLRSRQHNPNYCFCVCNGHPELVDSSSGSSSNKSNEPALPRTPDRPPIW